MGVGGGGGGQDQGFDKAENADHKHSTSALVRVVEVRNRSDRTLTSYNPTKIAAIVTAKAIAT